MVEHDDNSIAASPWTILDREPLWIIKVTLDPHFRPDLMSDETMERFRQTAPHLDQVSGTDIRQAIEAVILQEEPGPALEWMLQTGALEQVLPELFATVAFSQEAGRLHKDVWEHTKQVVAQCPSRPIVRWAALLHDIGKVQTRTIDPKGKVQFLGHAEQGAAMFRRIAHRLEFSKEQARPIQFLILKHLRANQYVGQWTDAAVRRFYRQMGNLLGDLLDLSRADITTGRKQRKRRLHAHLDELAGRIVRLKELDARTPNLPSGLGNQIMEHFHLQTSPLIGDIKDFLEQAIQDGVLEPGRHAPYYVEYLEQNPSWHRDADGRSQIAPDGPSHKGRSNFSHNRG
ncbi:MAG: HDIG domain-containing protein [Deltaproteobacteria bacterium]|nr:HDIG domain-containing protein [Deltaproteobacteria bacterium]